MTVEITLTVTVTVERTTGRFVSKDSIAEALRTEIEAANPGSIDVDESEYEVTGFEVSA
jgi:hypothetical protein